MISLELFDEYEETSKDDSAPYYDEQEWFRHNRIPCKDWDKYRYKLEEPARKALARMEANAASALTVGELIVTLEAFPANMRACVVWANAGYLAGINRVAIEKVSPRQYNHYDRQDKGVEVLVLHGD